MTQTLQGNFQISAAGSTYRELNQAKPVYTEPAPATDAQIMLFGAFGIGWKIDKPLFVEVEQDVDGTYIVSEPLFNVYGVGSVVSEAIQDYIASLAEFYELTEASAKTNPYDRPVLQKLRVYLSNGNRNNRSNAASE